MTRLQGIQLSADDQKAHDCLHNQLIALRQARDVTMLRGVSTKQATQRRRQISDQLNDVTAKMRAIRNRYV